MDMDDTLLRSDFTISYRTRNAIKKAESLGVTVVLASGRSPEEMDKFSKILGLHKHPGYLVSDNGALIQESNTGKTVHEARIEPDIALTVCDLAGAEGFPVQALGNNVMYITRKTEYSDYDQKLTGVRQEVVENFRTVIGDGCHKLIVPGDPMLLSPLESLLQTYLDNDITLFSGRPYYLEILPPQTNKGAAVSKIAEILGVKREEVLAIGDSGTDEAMILWAGLGVCMINGDERIKSVARLITENSNDDDGVADIIDRYILNRDKAGV